MSSHHQTLEAMNFPDHGYPFFPLFVLNAVILAAQPMPYNCLRVSIIDFLQLLSTGAQLTHSIEVTTA